MLVQENELRSQQQSLTHKHLFAMKNFRKARTRTLIQAGGLVKLVGLFDICGIKEGDDLQADISSRDKAATLLGFLMEALPEGQQIDQAMLNHWQQIDQAMLNHWQQIDQAMLNHWQQIGVRQLKMEDAKKRF